MRFGFSLVLIVPLHRSSVSLTLVLYVMMAVFSAGTAANRKMTIVRHTRRSRQHRGMEAVLAGEVGEVATDSSGPIRIIMSLSW